MRRASLIAITLAVVAVHGALAGYGLSMRATPASVPAPFRSTVEVDVPARRAVAGRLVPPPARGRASESRGMQLLAAPWPETRTGPGPAAALHVPKPSAATSPPGQPPAAATGSARAAGPPRPPRPGYPTRPPPTATLAYRLHQSNPDGRSIEGPAELAWHVDARGYGLQLALRPADAPARSWTSAGLLGPDGIEPRSLVQQDGQRETRRLESNPPPEAAAAASHAHGRAAPAALLATGSQDRWSWLAQLAAILEARPRAPPAFIDLTVTGLRGTVEQWRFARQDAIPLPAPPGSAAVPARARAARLLMMVREPERPYDLRIEAWLDPARHHWPAALRLSTPPSRWTFYLQGID